MDKEKRKELIKRIEHENDTDISLSSLNICSQRFGRISTNVNEAGRSIHICSLHCGFREVNPIECIKCKGKGLTSTLLNNKR